jgi:hypothetical protein
MLTYADVCRLRPRAEKLMQEQFTDKHPARVYFESLSDMEKVLPSPPPFVFLFGGE